VTLVFSNDEVKVKTKNHFSPLSPTLWKSNRFFTVPAMWIFVLSISIDKGSGRFLEKWCEVEEDCRA